MRSDQPVSGEEKNRCLSQNGRNIRWALLAWVSPQARPLNQCCLPSHSGSALQSICCPQNSRLVNSCLPETQSCRVPFKSPYIIRRLFPNLPFILPHPPQLLFPYLHFSPPSLSSSSPHLPVFTSSSSSPASRSSPYLPPFNTACTLTPHHHGGRSRQSPSLRHRWH